MLQRLDFTFHSLVLRDGSLDVSVHFTDLNVSLTYLGLNALALLGDLDAFSLALSVGVLDDLKLVLTAGNHILLRLELVLVVRLQGGHAHLESLLATSEIVDLGAESGKVAIIELVRLDLSSVGGNDALTDALAHLCGLVLLGRLGLNLLVLMVFTLLTGFAVSLVVAESGHDAMDYRSGNMLYSGLDACQVWRDTSVLSDGRAAADLMAGTSTTIEGVPLEVGTDLGIGARPELVLGGAGPVIRSRSRVTVGKAGHGSHVVLLRDAGIKSRLGGALDSLLGLGNLCICISRRLVLS